MTHKYINNQPFQFRLRGLLWSMTLLAVATAVATPFIRQWTASHWQYFGMAVLVFGLGALGRGALDLMLAQFRRRIIQRVGTPILQITAIAILPQGILAYPYRNSGRILLIIVAMGLSIPVIELHERARLTEGILFLLAATGANAYMAISWYLTRSEAVIGPAGLVIGNATFAWDHVGASVEDGCLHLSLTKFLKVRLDLTPEEMATVEAWRLAAKK